MRVHTSRIRARERSAGKGVLTNVVEQGTVVEVRGAMAVVAFTGGAGCSACGASCAARGAERVTEAVNAAGASVGDVVEVRIEDRALLAGAATAYLVPLACFFAGYFAGSTLASAIGGPGIAQAAGVVAAFTLLGVSFAGLRYAFAKDMLPTRQLIPVIERVVPRGAREPGVSTNR